MASTSTPGITPTSNSKSTSMVAPTLVSHISPTSTSIISSPSAPLQVLSSRSGVPLPVEIRRMIYRLLFAGSVIELSSGYDTEHTWEFVVKALHERNSGYGMFFASKDSQADVAPQLYSLVTWLFRGRHPVNTPKSMIYYKSHSYELKRVERAEFESGISPRDFLKERNFLPSIKHLHVSIEMGFPLKTPLPPQHLDNKFLIDSVKGYLRREWDRDICKASPRHENKYLAPCPKQDYSVSCTLWFAYPPYELKNGGFEADNTSDLLWSAKWIFNVNEESITRHPDAVTIETSKTVPRHLRALDAEGENELEDEDKEATNAGEDEEDNSESDDDDEPESDEAEETDADGPDGPLSSSDEELEISDPEPDDHEG